MAPETGFSSGEQQQSSSWLSGGGLGGLGSGSAGILGGGLDSPLALGGATVGLGAPWLDPTGHAGSPWGDLGGAAKDPGVGNQLTIKPERDSKAEIQAAVHTDGQQGPQTPGAAKSPPGIQSPEQLDKALADPNSADAKRVAALGMSPQQYKQEYLHEFMARLTQTDPFVSGPDGKPLIGKDGKPVSNYTEGQKAALQQWGYNPVIDPGHVVDHNKDTGLFAIRFDPTAAGAKNGAAPVVAFRGTEPDRGTKDLQSDVEGKYIGASQYDPAKAEIQQKLFGGPNKVDVVGYSLGGALAQKSLSITRRMCVRCPPSRLPASPGPMPVPSTPTLPSTASTPTITSLPTTSSIVPVSPRSMAPTTSTRDQTGRRALTLWKPTPRRF
jgi:hypothetical protein